MARVVVFARMRAALPAIALHRFAPRLPLAFLPLRDLATMRKGPGRAWCAQVSRIGTSG